MNKLSSHYLEPVLWYYMPMQSTFDMPPHIHPQYEIMYCEKGAFTVAFYEKADDAPICAQITENSFILINNNCYHKLIIDTPVAMILNIELLPKKHLPDDINPLVKRVTPTVKELFPDGSTFADLQRKNEKFYLFYDSQYIGTMLHKMVATLDNSEDYLNDVSVRLLINQLLIDVSSCYHDETQTLPIQTHVRKALLQIQQNFNKPISVSEIAKSVGITPAYLQQLFKTEFGKSVLEIITEKRIAKAKELLINTTLDNSTIAKLTGFGNRANLIYSFKKTEMCTPAEYRKSTLITRWLPRGETPEHHVDIGSTPSE